MENLLLGGKYVLTDLNISKMNTLYGSVPTVD